MSPLFTQQHSAAAPGSAGRGRECPRPQPTHRRPAGFTLVELFVALAVTAILLAIAIPSFKRISQSNRLTTAANDVLNAITAGRLEAVKHNAPAQFCSNVNSDNGSGVYAIACADHPGAVYVFQGASFAKVAASPTGVTAPIKYKGAITALRFRPDGLAYATTSSTPYSGTVVDICSSAVSTDNHRIISMTAGSILQTDTTKGACP